jgi:hypothetical protein
MQISSFVILGRPDFLPTTARSLCQNPHFGLKRAQIRLETGFRPSPGKLPAAGNWRTNDERKSFIRSGITALHFQQT